MRILFHHRIRSKDGQYVHLSEMVEALRHLGHDVRLCGPPSVESGRFGSDAGLIATLKRALPGALYELLEMGYALLDWLRLRRAVKRVRPDAIYERYNLFTPGGIWCSRRFGVPLLLEVNAPLYEERKRHGGIALDRLARASQQYVWRGADIVAPVTGVLAQYVREAGVPAERIVVIPNAINAGLFAGMPERESAKAGLGFGGRLVLGFTGFMRPWHGLDRVLEFVASEPRTDTVLLLVGDGPVREALEALARALGIAERLRITGIVDRSEVARYIAAFDVALQPDVVPYASPLKIYEYLAAGRAIVAPDMPNIREVLEDGVNARLFRPGDAASLRAALRELCGDSTLRRRLEAAAAATVAERGIDWNENARRVVEQLERRRRAAAPGVSPARALSGES